LTKIEKYIIVLYHKKLRKKMKIRINIFYLKKKKRLGGVK